MTNWLGFLRRNQHKLPTEEERRETDEAWEEYYAERAEQEQQELCPCGHRRYQHGGDDYCTILKCDCEGFGEPIVDEPREVHLSDCGSLGLTIYE